MAFRSARSIPEPSPVRPLSEIEAYARLNGLRLSLMAAISDRQRALSIATLEAELRRPTGTSGRQHRIREQLVRLRAEVLPARVAAPAADGLPVAVVRVLPLIAGELVEPTPDRDATLARIRSELVQLDAASREVDRLMDEVRAVESHRVALELKSQNRLILKTIWDCAVALSAAVEAERTLYSLPLQYGFEGRPDVLIRPGLDGASRLGHLSQWDSQISHFRRRLESAGVI